MNCKKFGKLLSKLPEDFSLFVGVPLPNGALIASPGVDIRIAKDKKALVVIMPPPSAAQPAQPEKKIVTPPNAGKITVVKK